MKRFVLSLLLFHVASAAMHYLRYFISASSGLQTYPELVAFMTIDGVVGGYYDSSRRRAEFKQDCSKKILEEYPQILEWYTQECMRYQHIYRINIDILKQQLNQTGGIHIFQRMHGCEWDDETGEVNAFNQFGYDGEDFIAQDPKTLTWIAAKPQALITKQKWDEEIIYLKAKKMFNTQGCPERLKKYLGYFRGSLQRIELPSVSLLQKTPSSPVTCHATGFYPERAMMFWRKDGEELHEDVDHGEILPNHNGSFQMSADLNLSSVALEDWRRYDCVFQLSGVKDGIVTRLDKAVIRTNWEKPSDTTFYVTSAVVVLALILIPAAGLIMYKRKKAKCPPSSPDNSVELSEKLNPDA
ncbi:major histocompatibility complex class I-related gene protein-like isoform 2-T2 [Symphorus nematophorus]